jgi:hypothetical protein
MSNPIDSRTFWQLDSNGKPMNRSRLFRYAAGTTTPIMTYMNASETMQNTSPVTLDSTRTAKSSLSPATRELILRNQLGIQQWKEETTFVTGKVPVLPDSGGAHNIAPSPGASLNLDVSNSIFYGNNYTTLQLAVAAACNGIIPGSVVLPSGTTTATPFVSIPSNCTITGQGVQTVVAGGLATKGSDILLKNFSVQGSLDGASDCIDIGVPATKIILDGVIVRNCANQGILLSGSVSNVSIQNGEVYKAGRAISGGQGTAAISISGGAISHISIINERLHDSSGGIQISNSGVVGQDVSGITISDSFIYSNAFDPILVTISNPRGGNIDSIRIENNEIYCNGWPANGIGFSASCTPGFHQSGAAASGSGVGVDLIQQQGLTILRSIITGNQIHDNTYEAVAASTNINPIVSTNGTTVTWVAGAKFNTQWVAGQYVIIAGIGYQIASVPSNTSMILSAPAGTQTKANSNMPAYMGAIIANNHSYNNGGANSAGAGAAVGPGFYNELSDGNAYSNNIAEGAWLDGYINFYSSFTAYNGDKAFSNGRGAATGNEAGFNNIGGFDTSYNGVTVGSHAAVTPVGFFIANSQNTNITTTSNHAATLLADTGVNTSYENLAETVPATIIPATGATVTCATGFTCTNRYGALSVLGGRFTTGSFATLSWPATQQVKSCTITQNSGTTFLSIGLNPIPVSTGFGIGAGVSIAGQTFTIIYNCKTPN